MNRGTRLLLVDDERLVLATLAAELHRLGYAVQTATRAEEADALARTREFDLVVLDMRMGDGCGLELGATLRTLDVPFMFLTAFADEASVAKAAEHGALGYLVKPLQAAQIAPAIETALARAREQRTLRERESQLNSALASSRETSIAVGILMAREGLDRTRAFELLRRQSRSQRRKVQDVASEMVLAFERLAQFRPKEPPAAADK